MPPAAEATKGSARTWCRRFNVNQSAHFSIAHLGYDNAFALAQEWCRRAEHFFSMWLDADDAEFEYTDLQLSSYIATEAWCSFRVSTIAGSAAHTRCTLVEAVLPRNP